MKGAGLAIIGGCISMQWFINTSLCAIVAGCFYLDYKVGIFLIVHFFKIAEMVNTSDAQVFNQTQRLSTLFIADTYF